MFVFPLFSSLREHLSSVESWFGERSHRQKEGNDESLQMLILAMVGARQEPVKENTLSSPIVPIS